MAVRFLRKLVGLFPVLIGTVLCTQCASRLSRPLSGELKKNTYTSYDRRSFSYQRWESAESQNDPKTIIIALHGFNGYSGDFKELGVALSSQKNMALYAPATRGQGLDPLVKKRGDIHHASEWIKDLRTFTNLLRDKHPRSEIVWLGESMGGLIALNALSKIPPKSQSLTQKQYDCDKLIIAAPIFTLGSHVRPHQRVLLRVASALFPKMRYSLSTLAGVDEVQMTHNSVHDKQALQNPWHIERQTLRLYQNLLNLIREAPSQLENLPCPLLILRGEHDSFSTGESVAETLQGLPKREGVTFIEYPNSHHLLFYDQDKNEVIQDIADWIEKGAQGGS